MALLREEWPELDDALRDERQAISAILEDAARLDPAIGSAALVTEGTYAVAVFSAGGRLHYSDPLLRSWLGEAPLETLVQADRAGVPLTFLESVEGTPLCARICDARRAMSWELPDAARIALAEGRDRRAAVVFAPSRSRHLSRFLGTAFALSDAEVALAEAILFCPTLDAAAASLGWKRDAARHVLRGVMTKVGATRTPELVRKLVDLVSAASRDPTGDEGLLVGAFDMTPAEARVASRMGKGLTAVQAADALGLQEVTARGHSKTALSKVGVVRTKDLSRVISEASGLATLAGAAEVVAQRSDSRLRVLPSADGARRIALFDYGPVGGEPAFILHGGLIGGTLSAAYVHELQARGLRPLVPQRPGFGLTDAAEDYLGTAVADLATISSRLGLPPVILVARGSGAAVAVEYAARHPDQVRKGVLINPLTPVAFEQTAPGIFTAASRTMLRYPWLIGTLVELMRRQSRSDLVEQNLRRTFHRIEADRVCLEDPLVMAALVRDAQALTARSSAGLTDEMVLYSRGWRPPRMAAGGQWSVIHLGAMDCAPVFLPWRELPDAELLILDGAGYLADLTHPAALAALIA